MSDYERNPNPRYVSQAWITNTTNGAWADALQNVTALQRWFAYTWAEIRALPETDEHDPI